MHTQERPDYSLSQEVRDAVRQEWDQLHSILANLDADTILRDQDLQTFLATAREAFLELGIEQQQSQESAKTVILSLCFHQLAAIASNAAITNSLNAQARREEVITLNHWIAALS